MDIRANYGPIIRCTLAMIVRFHNGLFERINVWTYCFYCTLTFHISCFTYMQSKADLQNALTYNC